MHQGIREIIHFRNIKVKELLPEWENLFARNDFSLWSKIDGSPITGGWRFEDGIIERRGIQPGDVITRKSYHDFELRFEWRISSGGHSGVKYRTRSSLGPEYQILDDLKHPNRKNPLTRAAALYYIFPADDNKHLKPVGEWNQGKIRAKGKTIEHWLNGQKVVDAEIGTNEWKGRLSRS